MTNIFLRSALTQCPVLGAAGQNRSKCRSPFEDEPCGPVSVSSGCTESDSVTTSSAMSWYSGSTSLTEENIEATMMATSRRKAAGFSSSSKLCTGARRRRNSLEAAGNSSSKKYRDGGSSKMSTSSSTTSLTSLSSFSSCSSSASALMSPNVHSAPRPVFVTSAEIDWPELVVDAPPPGTGYRSRRNSASSLSSNASSLSSSSFSSLSPEIVAKATGFNKKSKPRKTVRFHDVVKVRFVSWGEEEDSVRHGMSRLDSGNAALLLLWHTREEEVFMKQQPIDTLEDVLRRAISMATVSRNGRPQRQTSRQQRVHTHFVALVKELEQSGNFSARGLESSLKEIFASTSRDSCPSAAAVTAVLAEQDRLRQQQETSTSSVYNEEEEMAMALAKTYAEFSRPFRAEALRQGHLDTMEETNSRLSANSTRVEQRRNELWELQQAAEAAAAATRGKRHYRHPTTVHKRKSSRESFRTRVRDASSNMRTTCR